MPRIFKGLSITRATLLVVGAALVIMQTCAVIIDSVAEWREIRTIGSQRAEAALDMLEALHTQAMLNRRSVQDGDPAVGTLNGTMRQFSKSNAGIELWLTMSPQLLAFQAARMHEREPPKDEVDRAAIASARTVTAILDGKLRVSRPAVLGSGDAGRKECIACHSLLTGMGDGDVIGTYSVAVDLTHATAFWRANTVQQIGAGIGITLIILGVTAALLVLTTLRPLRNLTAATRRLASGNLSTSVGHTQRADELGTLARSLEIFRTRLLEKLRAEETVEHMSRHDLLTGLPNRAAFNEHIEQAISERRKVDVKIAAVIIDIARLSETNDIHGHATGDAVLKALSHSMVEALNDKECVARIGGNEFGAAKAFTDQKELLDFVGRLEKCINTTLVINGTDIHSTGHIGVAVCPDDATSKDELISKAGSAKQRAKAHMRYACFFEAAMDEAARSRNRLIDGLWGTIDRNELAIAYQVQKSLRMLETTGYEALLRWHSPELGTVSPAKFISLAEECSAIIPIGDWVLRSAGATAASWPQPLRIAVNISPIQLADGDLPERIHDILMETGLPPRCLELEITETAIIGDKTRARSVLRRIKNLGVAIALDDFGTGHSSLDTLRSFPFDKTKIDRSFVREVCASAQARTILRAIITLGHGLDISVIAEGIETTEQLALLTGEGCDEGQGYLFGKPRIAEAGEAPVSMSHAS